MLSTMMTVWHHDSTPIKKSTYLSHWLRSTSALSGDAVLNLLGHSCFVDSIVLSHLCTEAIKVCNNHQFCDPFQLGIYLLQLFLQCRHLSEAQ